MAESAELADPAPQPAEEAHLASRRHAPGRAAEFRAGRACARRAMRALGLPDAPLLPDETRAPVWPAGVVGSITHCAGYCAAAAAKARDLAALGIDAEAHGSFPHDVARRVAAAAEIASFARFVASPDIAACAVFSAKESLYKAVFPLSRTFLDFDEVMVVAEGPGRFSAICLNVAVAPLVAQVVGRLSVGPRHVFTTAIIPAAPGARP